MLLTAPRKGSGGAVGLGDVYSAVPPLCFVVPPKPVMPASEKYSANTIICFLKGNILLKITSKNPVATIGIWMKRNRTK